MWHERKPQTNQGGARGKGVFHAVSNLVRPRNITRSAVENSAVLFRCLSVFLSVVCFVSNPQLWAPLLTRRHYRLSPASIISWWVLVSAGTLVRCPSVSKTKRRMGKRPDAHGLISSGNGLRLRCSYSEGKGIHTQPHSSSLNNPFSFPRIPGEWISILEYSC